MSFLTDRRRRRSSVAGTVPRAEWVRRLVCDRCWRRRRSQHRRRRGQDVFDGAAADPPLAQSEPRTSGQLQRAQPDRLGVTADRQQRAVVDFFTAADHRRRFEPAGPARPDAVRVGDPARESRQRRTGAPRPRVASRWARHRRPPSRRFLLRPARDPRPDPGDLACGEHRRHAGALGVVHGDESVAAEPQPAAMASSSRGVKPCARHTASHSTVRSVPATGRHCSSSLATVADSTRSVPLIATTPQPGR